MSTISAALKPFQPADNQFGNVRFDEIRTEHYLPAVEEALAIAYKNLEALKSNPAEPDFENTVLALESLGEELGLTAGIYFTLFGTSGDEEYQKLAEVLSPKLAKFDSDLSLDAGVFARIQSVYDRRDTLGLNDEQLRLVEEAYSGFARNGARLPEEQQVRLRAIDQELSTLSPQFTQNLLKATAAFVLHLEKEEDLEGIPESARQAAAQEAARRKLEGWAFTLQQPSMQPLMTYSSRRDLREKMYHAHSSRSFRDEYDNQDLILRIVRLRHERAQLLGYNTHAQYTLERRMAQTPEAVMEFLDRLHKPLLEAAKKDLNDLKEIAKRLDGLDELMPWDIAYYSEKLKQERYELDEEVLRTYFSLEPTLKGMFEVAGRLYGIQFRPQTDLAVYHKDVQVFEVYQDERHLGLLYLDLFPREEKRGGAWCTGYRSQGLFRGELVRPHVAVVCSFTPPTEKSPSLLRLDEVTTLYHEFGHALHTLLSECTYTSLSGSNVFWDFVELPSQVMENWVYERETLDLFARHYETGEPIPAELVERMRKARSFMAGWGGLRQVSFGLLDMGWHNQDPASFKDVPSQEIEAMASTQLLPRVESSNMSCAFAHIFAGGYSAGYYSYKWAEVLDADAFAYFQEQGIFNKETARRFRENVLSRGNTAPPMDLYVAFRGRQPDPDALLRRDGLIA